MCILPALLDSVFIVLFFSLTISLHVWKILFNGPFCLLLFISFIIPYLLIHLQLNFLCPLLPDMYISLSIEQECPLKLLQTPHLILLGWRSRWAYGQTYETRQCLSATLSFDTIYNIQAHNSICSTGFNNPSRVGSKMLANW